MTTGGNLLISNASSSGQQMVRRLNIGFNTDFDPATVDVQHDQLPRRLERAAHRARRTRYAVLTGRVTTVASQAVLDASGKYVELGPGTQEGGINVYGSFIQDSWRCEAEHHADRRPPLRRADARSRRSATSCRRCRWRVPAACPGLGDGGLYSKCNFLKPGATGGAVPEFNQLK